MTKKPPTQTAGVAGFNAFTTPADQRDKSIDWQRLINLPPFEMFVAEQAGVNGLNVREWVTAQRQRLGDSRLFELYAKWHEAKGYWKNETPMGGII